MTSERVRAGVMAGVMAAAATSGAVAALAWRAGSVLRPWIATGRAVLGTSSAAETAALLGLGLHLAVAIGWGLLLAALAGGARGLRLVVTAAAVSLLALVVHSTVLPEFRLGFGLGIFPLHGAPLLYLYILQAVALAAGTRLAR
ncbi:MAG TPA: hypothetical protein VFX39_03680 [Gemmatimonadaceae bacterium]|nr:hypothetical protein [Gemmatimonadaceae bacterium]